MDLIISKSDEEQWVEMANTTLIEDITRVGKTILKENGKIIFEQELVGGGTEEVYKIETIGALENWEKKLFKIIEELNKTEDKSAG